MSDSNEKVSPAPAPQSASYETRFGLPARAEGTDVATTKVTTDSPAPQAAPTTDFTAKNMKD